MTWIIGLWRFTFSGGHQATWMPHRASLEGAVAISWLGLRLALWTSHEALSSYLEELHQRLGIEGGRGFDWGAEDV